MKAIVKSFKIYLIVIGICVAVIIPGTAYIYSMIKKDIPDLNVLRQQATSEASVFAMDHSIKECIGETMNKIRPCRIHDYSCRITGKIFLKECLAAARDTPGFCDAFPKGDETGKTDKWRINTCLDHKDIHNIVCTNTFQEAEIYCAAKTKKSN